MISVIIPAHNEENVIEPCLRQLVPDPSAHDIEVLVSCNGCTDRTAERARAMGASKVIVLEVPVASKVGAINAALREARGGSVVVVDADVQISAESVRRLVDGMEQRGALAAAPEVRMRYLPGTTWAVKEYYRFWLDLPYVREGMMAAGVYSLSAEGRRRVGELPAVIADDGYVRMLFTDQERVEVPNSVSEVLAPLSLEDLVKIKTRSRVGWFQLRQMFPELMEREVGSRRHARSFARVLSNPARAIGLIPYLYVCVVARLLASRQMKRIDRYRWERDDGSRRALARVVAGEEVG